MKAAGTTNIGRVREENEDAFLATSRVLAVADGMGGLRAGGVAARTAIATAEENLGKPLRRPKAALLRTFRKANQAVRGRVSGAERDDSGTTLTIATIKDNQIWIGHVGDSRAYLLRRGELRQLTRDHSLVGELVRRGQLHADKARTHPKRHVITRAIGSQREIRPDIFSVPFEPGDRLILCTDGLTGGIDDDRLAEITSRADSPGAAGRELVEAANEAGGSDNITVVVGDPSDPMRRRDWLRPLRTALVLAAVLGVLLFGAIGWLNGNYYLSDINGRVAVNRGLPETAGGYELGRTEKLTTIKVADLPDYYQKRLKKNVIVGNSEELSKVLDDLRELAHRSR